MSAESSAFGGHRPRLQTKTFTYDLRCTFNVVSRMSRRQESSFELRRGKVNAAIETGLEEAGEFFRVASLGAGQIRRRFRREKETEHRTDAVKDPGELQFAECLLRQFFEPRAIFFQESPAIDPFQLAQLRQTRRHRERISRECAGLINGTER